MFLCVGVGLRRKGDALAVMTQAELAADNGLFTGKSVGKSARPRASDELEPLHRVRWSWHPQARSPSDAEGAKRVRSSAEVWPTHQALPCSCGASAYDVGVVVC